MNIITALFCVLVKQVISETTDIYPANIMTMTQQKTIREKGDLYLTCSTFGIRKQSIGFVYLCKNGVGFKKIMQKPNKNDTIFQTPRVGLHDSGNYSCVYSTKNYTLSAVTKQGNNIIQILVIANFLPADISVLGQSAVYEGDHVEFKCTLSSTLHTLNECQFIQSYLWKNETISQMQAFDVARMEASFAIEGAVMRDSGHYSCTVLPSECIQVHQKELYGKNVLFLEVKASVPLMIFPFGLMLLLILVLWWITHKRALCGLCGLNQHARADMLEQTPEVEVEAQDEEEGEQESFSMDEDVQFLHNEAADGCTSADDCEGIYSIADEDDDDNYEDIDHIYQQERSPLRENNQEVGGEDWSYSVIKTNGHQNVL